MGDIARIAKARGIIVVLSDLFDDEEGFERGLQQLRFGGHEVIVFHVLDPDELEFPFKGRVEFIGLEGAATLETSPADIRKSYLKEMDAMRQRMRRRSRVSNNRQARARRSPSGSRSWSGERRETRRQFCRETARQRPRSKTRR